MKRLAVGFGVVMALVASTVVGFGETAVLASPASVPATVTAVEEMPPSLWVPGAANGERVTYWTTGSDGQAALSSGAVFLPPGPAPEGGWPVVSWAHGTVGLDDNCAPSLVGPGNSERDFDYLSEWMRQGYAIVATDYIGLGTPGIHAYLDGRAEAHAVIDMVRAARAVEPSLSPKWVVVGQSQGGGAAVWTAALATGYAPDLDYRGAVATAPASNIVDILRLAGPYVPDLGLANLTTYALYVLRGLKAARPEWDLDSYLTPAGRDAIAAAETTCYTAMHDKMQGIGFGTLLSRPLAEGDFTATARPVMDVPLTGYDRPLFIGQGTADRSVPIPLTLKLVADLNLHGTRPALHIYPGADHSGVMMPSQADSIPFVARLFA